jgi:hypothetical protein
MVPDSGMIGDIWILPGGRWLDERTIRCGARFLSCLWNDARGAKVVPVALIGYISAFCGECRAAVRTNAQPNRFNGSPVSIIDFRRESSFQVPSERC